MKAPRLAAVLAAALVSASSATPAQEAGRAYVGGAIGQSDVRFDDSVINVPGAATNSVLASQVETGYKLFAGYRFHRNAALEAGYANFGQFHARNTTTGPSGTAEFESKRRGWTVDAVGHWPIAEGVSLLGRLGGLFSSTSTTRTATGGVTIAAERAHPKKSELNLHWGVGVSWDFSRSMALRAEYEQAQKVGDANTGEANAGLISAGLLVRF